MNGILSIILGSYRSIYFAVAGLVITVYSYIISRNAKLKTENQALNEGIEEIKDESNRIVTIQKKQAEIFASPASNSDDIHERLLDLSRRSKQNDKQDVG
jgi:hypothetical protein